MTAAGIASQIGGRVIPVVVIDEPAIAGPLADALLAGGIRCAEVTLRTPTALDCIRAMSKVPGMVVGAGTVTAADQVDQVVDAGAQFVASPGLSERVVRRCREMSVPIVPGVVTATEVMAALDLGLFELKFFPAESSGGSPAVAALGGPFPHVTFVPSGGIGLGNAKQYLSLPNVAAIGGSWITPPAMQGAGDFAGITRLATQATAMATGED